MPLARSLLLRAADNDWLARQMSERAFARRACRRFMPGETLDRRLLAAVCGLAAQGLGTLLTQLGEGLTDEPGGGGPRPLSGSVRPDRGWSGCRPRSPSSPRSWAFDFSFDVCKGHLAALADRAEATGSRLWIDMEDSRYVDRTLDLYRATLERHPRGRSGNPSYLRRTPADIEALIPLSRRSVP
ncbi:MAG: hypothetical protein R2909_21525 [Gemmatimonadales bacterium]